MPPVFGPWSPSNARLWSSADGRTRALHAVGDDEERRFAPAQELLDDHLRPGVAEPPVHHHVPHGGLGRRGVLGHDHALAGGESVGLDAPPAGRSCPARRTSRASAGLAQVTWRAVGTPWAAIRRLANALLDSMAAAPCVGPQARRPAAVMRVDDAGGQRRFGPDDRQVDGFPGGEGDDVGRAGTASRGRQGTSRAMPALPGAQKQRRRRRVPGGASSTGRAPAPRRR